MKDAAELRRELPPALKARFDSLGSFVTSVIQEIEKRGRVPEKRRTSADVKQDIALLVFIASLREFLREGSRAAAAAAEKAVSLGLSGFTVGRQTFTPDNENTRRGNMLADALWEQIEDNRLRNLLDSDRSLSRLIEVLYAVSRNPQRLDQYRKTTRRSD